MTTGLSLPAMFTAILGAAIGTSVNLKGSRFEQAYNKNSTGGLIYEILCGDNNNQGYRFIIVVFALGAIANGIPGSYSLSLPFNVYGVNVLESQELLGVFWVIW